MADFANDMTLISPATRQFLDRRHGLLINGEWVEATNRDAIAVIDPTSGRQISSLTSGGADDIDAAVAAASLAFETSWARFGPAERERVLLRLADLVEANAVMLAELESIDVGMPISMSRNLDVAGTVAAIRYMAGWPSKISGRTVDVGLPIPGSEFFGFTRKEPVGVVGAIIPWNVPLMLAAWKIAPALAAGCTIVVKPSEEASLSVLAFAGLAREAGIPDGVVNVVTGVGANAGEALVKHPNVSKISFTGSTATGTHLARCAADGVKKLSLELGGKSPQILFADADFERSLPLIANTIFLNSGQICVAGSRLYVERKIADQATEALTSLANGLKLGPSLDGETEVGPVANARQKKRVLQYIEEARTAGASVEDGYDIAADGAFVRPTIVSNVTPAMRISREEVFGPVLTVTPFDDIEEAAALANDSIYGLSACVWTSNLRTAHKLIPRIKSGRVCVNTDPIPYPSLPEGGRKASGYGRDLGEEAIEGYLETKAVLMRVD